MNVMPQVIAGVHRRRADLYASMVVLEWRLAAPTGTDAGWTAAVTDALADLRAALEAHVAEVETAGGLFAQVLSEAPGLAPAVVKLRRDHEELRRLAAAVDAALRAGPDEARREGVDLLRELALHRHRGADLVYEAFQVDIGAVD